MSKQELIYYACEKCGNKIGSSPSPLNIVTPVSEGNTWWSRLHVQILHRHGVHNDATTERADLCRSCTVELLKDALNRVMLGERATAGSDDSYQSGWEEDSD